MLRSLITSLLLGILLAMGVGLLRFHSNEYRNQDKLDELKHKHDSMNHDDYNALWKNALDNKEFRTFIENWKSSDPDLNIYSLEKINFYSLPVQTSLIKWSSRSSKIYDLLAFGLLGLSLLVGIVIGIRKRRKKAEGEEKVGKSRCRLVVVSLLVANIAVGFCLFRSSIGEARTRMKRMIEKPPMPVSQLKAQVLSHNQIQLTWEDVEREKGYKIFRSLFSNKDFAWKEAIEIATLNADTASYLDIGLSSDTSYSYRVVPYNEYGQDKGNSFLAGPAIVRTKPLPTPENK